MDKKKIIRTTEQANEVVQQMEHLHLLRESQSSCDITQDAKGSIKVTVKAYADTIDEAVEKALKAFNKAKKELKI